MNIESDGVQTDMEQSPRTVFLCREFGGYLKIDHQPVRLNNVKIDTDTARYLLDKYNSDAVALDFKHNRFELYFKDDYDVVEFASILTKRGYFSHLFAAYIHEMVEFKNVIYINEEQKMRNTLSGRITQKGIDSSFSREQRVSNNMCEFDSKRIVFLNGANTDRTGVMEINRGHYSFSVTDLERTLIDLVVRPAYSGGVEVIYNCYKKALGENEVDVKKILRYLSEIRYSFPYAQTIGFFMYLAGHDHKEFREEIKFDFYCDYAKSDLLYSKKWKMYYPSGLKDVADHDIE